MKEICEAISSELVLQKDYLQGGLIETIYFGGGTPSVLSTSLTEKILITIRKNFRWGRAPEITLEANPEDLSTDKLKSLKLIGVNRLSIGAQSFDDAILKFLNRVHNALQIKQAIENARQTGFDNINVDLIYAIPQRSNLSLERDLDFLIQSNPEHISAYSLTIEEKTVFGNWSHKHKFTPMSDEENAIQFDIVMNRLVSTGYEHYEISNYSKPGFESRHNCSYWGQEQYLGVGPSAHSYNGVSRQFNVANNHTYLKSIQEGKIPSQIESLTWEMCVNEYIMTSLRTMWGCDIDHLKRNLQFDLLANQKEYILNSIARGLMKLDNDILTLTNKGKLFADKLSSDLFLITS